MTIIDNFDPFQDFWVINPQARLFFKDEYENNTPSQDMWALFLFYHPSSKLFNESPTTRKKLILEDYPPLSSNFSFDSYKETITKIQKYALTRAEVMMSNWADKLHQRDEFIASQPYTESTYKMLDAMLDVTPSMWKQYETIKKMLSKDDEAYVVGDQEESLSEKQLI